ncbi:MAG: prepilin peptidase, partial [Desulfobacterales bacterium]
MNIPETGFTGIMAFIFGACIGSFINVCIYRIPNSTSIIYPPSACPRCNTQIRFYDNIPLFSYLLLRGRCRHCNEAIALRYFLVEIIGGGFALVTLFNYGVSFEGFIYYVFITILLIISFIDIDSKTIPDIITIPGIPLFFLASFALPAVTTIDSLFGILAGGGSLFIVALIYYLFTKKEGMGGG